MLTLFAFGPAFGLPDPSPFVTKAEVLLKMSGLPYEKNFKGFNRAPKGKLPYLQDGDQLIADSTFIRWHLERTHGIQFDANYCAAELALAWSIERMLEDHLYWIMLDSRWGDEANFQAGPAAFFKRVPWFLRGLVSRKIRGKLLAAVYAQGMGRHQPAERMQLALRDIETLSVVLGDKPYLLGNQPCGADATVYAFLLGALCPLFQSEVRTQVSAQAHLVAYVARMTQQYFPDLNQNPV